MVRILSIINLCLIFVLFAWYGGYPFLGELFEYKERSLLYQNVMGNEELGNRYHNIEEKKTLQRNRERFEGLPLYVQEQIYRDYLWWQLRVERSGWKKLGDSMVILAFATPVYLRAWLLFSLIISILVLRERPYVRQALWVMPALAVLYVYANIESGFPPIVSADRALFPAEGALIEQFHEGEMSGDILEQRRELSAAWNRFLVRLWSKEEPSIDFNDQVEEGKFYFTVARLERLGGEEIPSYYVLFHQKQPLYVLLLFLVWNIIYSVGVYVQRLKEE